MGFIPVKKKPVVVKAMQYTDGISAYEIIDYILAKGGTARFSCRPNGEFESFSCLNDISQHYIVIETMEGAMNASLNDWVIQGIKDEFYPCKPDIFESTYDY